jgi:hypothetical protein
MNLVAKPYQKYEQADNVFTKSGKNYIAVANVYVGKADWGYFIDLQCNEEHKGQSCDCKNVAIVEYKNHALEIGKQKADNLGVPLLTDWD